MDNQKHEIARGHWGTVVDLGDGRVAKYFRNDIVPASAQIEAQVAQIAYQMEVSTPKPLGWFNEDGVNGIIFEKINGETLARLVLERPWKLIWATREMAKIFVRIHSVPIKGLQTMHVELEERIDRAVELSESQKSKALKILRSLEMGDRLCHKDYHPGNLMVEGQVCHVIDWGGAVQGPPIADLTHAYVLNKVDGTLEDVPWVNRFLIQSLRGLYIELFVYFYARFSPDLSYFAIKSGIRRWIIPIAAARLASYGDFEKPALMKILRSHRLL